MLFVKVNGINEFGIAELTTIESGEARLARVEDLRVLNENNFDDVEMALANSSLATFGEAIVKIESCDRHGTVAVKFVNTEATGYIPMRMLTPMHRVDGWELKLAEAGIVILPR